MRGAHLRRGALGTCQGATPKTGLIALIYLPLPGALFAAGINGLQIAVSRLFLLLLLLLFGDH